MIRFLLLVIILTVGFAALWVFARWVLQLGTVLICCAVLYCLIGWLGWPLIVLGAVVSIVAVIAGRIAERRAIQAAAERFRESLNRQP